MTDGWLEGVVNFMLTDKGADISSKLALAAVAIFSMIISPIIQWSIAKKQAQLQASIAQRQVADSISTKRQAWIDSLRSEISELFAQASNGLNYATAFNRSNHDFPDDEKHQERRNVMWGQMLGVTSRITELSIRIKLRLNQVETDHIELMRLIDAMRKLVSRVMETPGSDHEVAISDWKRVREETVTLSAKILKAEWVRVKRGDL